MGSGSEDESAHHSARAPGRRANLSTVAEALGVSRATVSNAYNRPDQLSARLRARVLRTAEDLGYPGPNPVAATLSRGTVGAIGVVFDDPVSYAFTDPAEVLLLQGISEVCEQADLGLVLAGGPGSSQVRHALVDGFVAQLDLLDDDRLDALAVRDLPVVIIDGPSRPGAARVSVDDRAGARAAAGHLAALGHRHVAVIPTPLHPDGAEGRASLERQETARYQVTRERLAGYREALTAAGIRWSDVRVEERAPFGREAGHRAATALLTDGHRRPTALLAMSDETAAGALRAARELGIPVPDQLSIVGFDDTMTARSAHPPLTTVHQPHRDKGRLAAQLLRRETPVHDEHRLAVDLIVRGSTAPPADSRS